MISDVKWVNNIPNDWTLVALKRTIKKMGTGLNPRKNFELNPKTEANIYYVTIRNFKNGQLFLDENCDRINKDAWDMIQSRSDLHKGDILFASISEEGNVYVLKDEPYTWNINESVFCIRVDEKWFIPRFFAYMVTNKMYYDDLRSEASGTTFLSIKQNKLKNSIILAPPVNIQQQIVAYLDAKCDAIDKAIAYKRSVIEKLKEYRTAVITKAVTKGLNPNVKMKDSGIDWYGNIPKDWKFNPLKNISHCNLESLSNQTDGNFKFDYIDIGSVEYGRGIIAKEQLIFKDAPSRARRIVKERNIIISTVRTYLKAIAKIDKFVEPLIVSTGFAVLEAKYNKIIPEFLYYAVSSAPFISEIEKKSDGANYPSIKTSKLMNIKLLLPNIREQQQIVDYLDVKCSKIDTAIQKQEQAIAKLEEYRKSVIYYAVTGKIDCGKAV